MVNIKSNIPIRLIGIRPFKFDLFSTCLFIKFVESVVIIRFKVKDIIVFLK